MTEAPLPPSFLAFDLGASSGRAVLGTLLDGRLRTIEVGRFATPLAERAAADGRPSLFWDLEALWHHIRGALDLALRLAPTLQSVSVDTWAVDYVPVGADGEPLRDPYAYRDSRTHGRAAEVFARVPAAELYARTGIQPLPFNTVFQVADDVEREPEVVGATRWRLLLADYLLYRLSGRAVAERTVASSTGLLDARTGDWAADLIERAGLPAGGWPEVVAPGTVLGPLRADLVPAGRTAPRVVATCSHDTAAAVAAVPARGDRRWAFVSSGTWALVGVVRDEPVLSEAARRAGFTNEAGLDGATRLLKNRTGFWVLEECLREWASTGDRPDYDALVAEAERATSTRQTISLDTPAFAARGDHLAKVEAACREHGVPVPQSRGALVRLLLESQAEAIRQSVAEVEALTGDAIEVLHVVGGGARNGLLNRLTAEACGVPVLAGPAEATSLGNLAVQARAVGVLGDRSVADLIRASADEATRLAPDEIRRVDTPTAAP